MADIDTTIRALFDKLKARKAKVEELKAQIAKSWKTNGAFRPIGGTSTINIQTATAETIHEAAVQLCLIFSAKSEAGERLGISLDVKYFGYSVDDWFADFKKRLASIDVREEERLMAELETRLNQVLSPEERRRIEVELLAKELG